MFKHEQRRRKYMSVDIQPPGCATQRHPLLQLGSLLLALTPLFIFSAPTFAQSTKTDRDKQLADQEITARRRLSGMRRTTMAQRQAASKNLRSRGIVGTGTSIFLPGAQFPSICRPIDVTPTVIPPIAPQADYLGACPNWAFSPLPSVAVDPLSGVPTVSGGLRKFVGALPNIPVAVQATRPAGMPAGDYDYYEIGLVEYRQQMHPDLANPTKIRGYKDFTSGATQYLGPLIVANKNKPVRIKFKNQLPTGAAGNLFVPVDTTIMGAGLGPDGVSMYKQNRANLHLHGGNTPWISDGTPHQWTVPAGETTPYKKGVS